MRQERRQAPRVAERFPVALRDAGVELHAQTKNLSAVGTYCTLDHFIAPMTKLQLQFELPYGSRRVRVRCSGVVVRVEPVIANAQRGHYNVAIFFTELTQRNRSAISEFVRRRLSANPFTH
jgi:hypothetical protein